MSEIISRLEQIEAELAGRSSRKEVSLLVFSGEHDKLLAAFTIATAAAACGMRVTMFFTFWGTAALKRRTLMRGKGWMERAFALLLPGGVRRGPLSRLDLGGMGARMLAAQMRRKNISDLPTLIEQSASLGVRIFICQMSMNLMGIRPDELIEYPDVKFCGAAKFLQLANAADSTFFI